MSTLKLSECEIEKLITHATIIGKFIPEIIEDYMKLARLAWSFRRVVNLMVREVVNGTLMKNTTKKLYHINYQTISTLSQHINTLSQLLRDADLMAAILDIYIIRKLFIISRGNKWDRGNRNIKLTPREKHFEILIKYPWDSSRIKARALIGQK